MGKTKCVWCGRPGEGLIEVQTDRGTKLLVHAEHAELAKGFAEKVEKNTNLFIGLILLFSAAIVLVLAFGWDRYLFLPMGALAVVTWVYPFPTPQTVALLGIRRAIITARAFAVVLLGIGFYLSIYP
jgi:hypothetical protein